MDTPGIQGLPPIHGLRSVKPESERQNRRNGGEAFAELWEGTAEGAADGAAGAGGEDDRARGVGSRSLQQSGSVIRRDPTDGEFHVDILV